MTLVKFKQLSEIPKSLALNSIIMLFWWLGFNPGFYSADSFSVIEMARTGKISSEYTTIWAIFVKIVTFNGSHPEIATLFFSQILALSVTLFAHAIFKGKVANWSSAALCLTPLVGAMGITLWHDIPMTAGFLLVVTGAIRLMRKEKFPFTLMGIGIFFASFRFNGIPTLFLTFILMLFIHRPRKLVLVVLFLTSSIGGITSTLDSKLSPATSVHSDGFINWMRYDLSCYAASSSDIEFFQKELTSKSTIEFWQSSQACTWFNDSKSFLQRPADLEEKIPSAWLALALKDPVFVLTTHMKRHEYLNPLPLYGPPRMPFIHTTLEYTSEHIRFRNAALSEKLRVYPRIWNYFNFIFGYSGMWLTVILFFAWRKRNLTYFGIGTLGLVLNAGLFVFAIIPDGRFSLFVLIAGQLIAIGEFQNYLRSRKAPEVFNDSLRNETKS